MISLSHHKLQRVVIVTFIDYLEKICSSYATNSSVAIFSTPNFIWTSIYIWERFLISLTIFTSFYHLLTYHKVIVWRWWLHNVNKFLSWSLLNVTRNDFSRHFLQRLLWCGISRHQGLNMIKQGSNGIRGELRDTLTNNILYFKADGR